MKPEIRVLKEESSRIKIAFPYNPTFVERVKAIKGRKYHQEGNPPQADWSFPNSNGIFEKILLEYGIKEIGLDYFQYWKHKRTIFGYFKLSTIDRLNKERN